MSNNRKNQLDHPKSKIYQNRSWEIWAVSTPNKKTNKINIARRTTFLEDFHFVWLVGTLF